MRTPVRIPPSSPPPCDDPIAAYRALFRDEPPLTVNVLEFTCCDLDGCDCGATIRLGMKATTLLNLLVAVRAAGLTVREIPEPDLRVLPADWETRRPFSLWAGALQLGKDAAAKSRAATAALLTYLRDHGVPMVDVVTRPDEREAAR